MPREKEIKIHNDPEYLESARKLHEKRESKSIKADDDDIIEA